MCGKRVRPSSRWWRSPATAAYAWVLAGLLLGGGALEAAELAPQGLEETPGVSAASRGRYSERTLSLALEIDREGARLVSFTVKERPFVRSLDLPAPRSIDMEDDRNPQIEVVLVGPGDLRHTQRIQTRGICLLHPPEAEPHVVGDTIRLHRETILVEAPELAGFDRVEVAYHEGDPDTPTRRSLGAEPLDAARFTPAGRRVRYDELAFAVPAAGETLPLAPRDTSGEVHWPEEYDDPDIYRVAGNEAEVDRRINITVVPDGYTYAQKALLDSHFDQLVSHFRNDTPSQEHDPFLNYILIYAYSSESGTDQCDCDIIVDTAMGTRFPESNPTCGHTDNRCLYYGGSCDTASNANITAAEQRAPASEEKMIMVNTARYGGCGGYRAVYSAATSSALNLAVHELGHAMGGLADEYSYNPDCGSYAGEINTSVDPVEGAWPEWIADIGPPHEGAQYYQQCVYRPEAGCRMRSLGQPFCRVCRQHYSLVYFDHDKVNPTAPLESIIPGLPLQAWIGEEIDFSVVTRLGVGTTNVFSWEIEGPGYPDPTPVGTGGPAYSHTFTELGDYTLSCEIVADTNLIKPSKSGANVDMAAWPVHAVDPDVDSDDDGFTPFEGDCVDTNPSIYPGAPQLCDGLNNDCDDTAWPAVPTAEIDDDEDGYSECQGDCDDSNPQRSPGLPELGCDGIDNDCDAVTPDVFDADGDTFACDVDCDDDDGNTYPGAGETNDAIDNQCPGDVGFGFVDEISLGLGFPNPADPTELCWPAQPQATRYEVLRGDTPDLSGSCWREATVTTCLADPELPAAGAGFFYLVRSLRPRAGSLGWDSSGMGRENPCGLETSCRDGIDNDLDSYMDCLDPDCLGSRRCPGVLFYFWDSPEDDLTDEALYDFLAQLQLFPTDFMRVGLSGAALFWQNEWCTARADWYRDRYLALAPTSGSEDSGSWDKWYRSGYTEWIGPETTSLTNTYGTTCAGPYAWCSEMRPGLFGIAVVPDDVGSCELMDTVTGCGDGTWSLMLGVGVDWSAACGSGNDSGGGLAD